MTAYFKFRPTPGEKCEVPTSHPDQNDTNERIMWDDRRVNSDLFSVIVEGEVGEYQREDRDRC